MNDIAYDAELKVPGDPAYLRPVRYFIRELAKNTGFSSDKASDIEVAVDEVFSNAVEHGSADTGSYVMIRCSSDDGTMKILISDAGQGQGSNKRWKNAWSDAIRRKSEPGTERGHGILLASDLTDEMSMEANSIGGVDVYLVIYKEDKRVAKK